MIQESSSLVNVRILSQLKKYPPHKNSSSIFDRINQTMMKMKIFFAFLALGSATAFAPSGRVRSSPLVASPQRTVSPHPTASFIVAKQETKLPAAGTEPETTRNLAPSAFFGVAAASLAKLCFDIQGAGMDMTIGLWALLFTSAAVGYDNFIISLGAPFFGDAETNEKTYNTLKTISYPRFTAHAVLVPFLYVTVAEIGKAMDIGWLQGDIVQTLTVVAAAVLGTISRVRFVNSDGIDLSDTSDSEGTWEKELIWFTYKKAEFLYVVPAILLAIFNLAVGIAGFGGEYQTSAIWMLVAAVAVLYGSAKPSYIMRFSGNLGEVVMLWGIFEALQSL